MNLLNKLTIKNLKLNKKRTIVTIMGIILSVALITAVASIYASGIQSLINYETYQKGNFHVAFYNVPIDELYTFKDNRGIENVHLTKNIGYAKINTKNENKPYAYVKAFTKDSLENLSIKLVEGRLPENENEIIIPTHLKTNGRLVLKVGDSITLNIGKRVTSEGYELDQSNPYYESDSSFQMTDASTGEVIDEGSTTKSNEKIIDTVSKTYKIVGIIERPASNIESYSAPGYTFITYVNENDLVGNIDVYAKYTKEGSKNCYKITANILGVDEELFEKANSGGAVLNKEEENRYSKEMEKAKYDISINSYLIALETNPISTNTVGELGVVVCIVIGIIVFTSVFCIKNSFDISITEKIKQYGMLRSIGATKKQIKKNVFYEATILGIIGIPLGILSGFFASFILIIVSNYYLKQMLATGIKLEFIFSLTAVVISIILGIVTLYFSAFRSAKRASKVSPIESIRNSANIKIKSKKLKSPKFIKKLFGMGGEISFKNLKRNKKKYRTTVISIIVSVFVFIALYSFMSSAFDEIENEFKVLEYNAEIHTKNIDDNNYEKFVATTTLDSVEDYTILRESGISYKDAKYNPEYVEWLNLKLKENTNSYLTFYSLGKAQYEKYVKSLGLDYDDIKDKGILLDYRDISKYIEDKNKYEHKYMRVYDYNAGDKIEGVIDNDKSYNLEIGYVTDTKPFGLKNSLEIMCIISDELFDKIGKTDKLNIYYKVNDVDKFQSDVMELLEDENYSSTINEENIKMMNNLFTLLGIFLYGFIIVISLIGITNIFNTITTNMELRKQEFAMLKSVGMTTKEFNRMIRLESLFMGVKSLIFGITIGIILSYIMHLAQDTGMPYKLPIVAIILSICVVFLLISIIMRYSIRKINKQNTIETIRNENI